MSHKSKFFENILKDVNFCNKANFDNCLKSIEEDLQKLIDTMGISKGESGKFTEKEAKKAILKIQIMKEIENIKNIIKSGKFKESIEKIDAKLDQDFLKDIGVEKTEVEEDQKYELSEEDITTINNQFSQCWFATVGFLNSETEYIDLKLTMNLDGTIANIEINENRITGLNSELPENRNRDLSCGCLILQKI